MSESRSWPCPRPRGSDGGTAVARRLERHVRQLADDFERIDDDTSLDEWLDLRASVGNALARLSDAMEDIDRLFETGSARNRILLYLRRHVRQVVTKDQLSGVAGISEWARRVRELREEEGWAIHSSTTNPNLKPGEYVLIADEPQPEIVRVWAAAKSAAKLKTQGGAVDPARRILEFLREIHPLSAGADQLAHVAGSRSLAENCLKLLERRGHEFVVVDSSDVLNPGGVALVEA